MVSWFESKSGSSERQRRTDGLGLEHEGGRGNWVFPACPALGGVKSGIIQTEGFESAARHERAVSIPSPAATLSVVIALETRCRQLTI
ncbi:MAG: hypothetical protein BMS9Abin13_417 [Patescibacteria group bacterium]|nr:MAG: hypothetical protein BMS9Abin13_417 [Patescibacteria group bacterium]